MAISNSRDELLAKAVISACGQSELRTDGYQNVLTKYGTKRDSSSAFSFVPENFADDYTLSINYQFNGLFAKIIDLPAGEAVSKGFTLNIADKDIDSVIMDKWEDLNAEEAFETAVKWARLYGGSIIVPLINDGRGLDEPLNFRTIRGIDELKVFEAAIVNPIYQSAYYAGVPEYYQVNSIDGIFTVHSSRCLLFKNGMLPELAIDTKRRVFGFSEYDRIKAALREAVTSHGYAPRMLERSIQPILKIKDLAALLESDAGEDIVVKRLQVIDLARSMFNSLAIDSDGEDYDFKTASFAGVKEIIDSTCNMLSAVTDIPQTLLFGRAPEGMNSTGESDLENYYNMVRRIQSRTIKAPHKKLINIIIQSLVRTGRLEEAPTYKLEYNPLWSMSEQEQASVEQTKAQTKLIKAQTAQTYVGMQALDPSEIRVGLAKEEEYDVETLLDDVPDDELFASIIDESSDEPPAMGNSPTETLPQQPMTEEIPEQQDSLDEATAAAVLVVNPEGKILCGVRTDNNLVCGPGGHIEEGEQPIIAAIREAQEEFNITPTSLIPLATLGENNALHHKTDVFLCTSYTGTPKCDDKEMKLASFITLEELLENSDKMFKPFLNSLEVLVEYNEKLDSTSLTKENHKRTIKLGVQQTSNDGGPGSGNFGHEGRKGKVGGSAPEGEVDNESKAKKAGSEASKDCTFSPEIGEKCQQIYDDIRSKEPEISKDIIDISSSIGSELEGLEFSVKTASSLEGKIKRKISDAEKKGLEPVDAETMLSKMGDIVRYTQVCSVDDIPDITLKTVESLEKKGYKIKEIDNKYLTAKEGEYKGIHIQAIAPNGVSVEMQIHSRKSFELKMKAHKLYEISRDTTKPKKERIAAREEMKKLLKEIPVPKGIDRIKPMKTEDD